MPIFYSVPRVCHVCAMCVPCVCHVCAMSRAKVSQIVTTLGHQSWHAQKFYCYTHALSNGSSLQQQAEAAVRLSEIFFDIVFPMVIKSQEERSPRSNTVKKNCLGAIRKYKPTSQNRMTTNVRGRNKYAVKLVRTSPWIFREFLFPHREFRRDFSVNFPENFLWIFSCTNF